MHLRPVIAAVLVASAAAACAGTNPVPSLVAEVATPDGRQAASDTEGRFRLDFALPKRTFTEQEAIEGLATLSVIGPGNEKLGASGGPILFGVTEVGGGRAIGPASRADCRSFAIGDGSPITSAISKSGGWSGDDPNAAFYEAFFADKEVHLPPGTWDITAQATFSEGECDAHPHELSAPIRIEVVPGS